MDYHVLQAFSKYINECKSNGSECFFCKWINECPKSDFKEEHKPLQFVAFQPREEIKKGE